MLDAIVISEFDSYHMKGELTIVDRFSYLDALLRKKSSEVTKDAREISWRFSFVAACIRRMRDFLPAVCVDTAACNDSDANRFSLRRWSISAWIINSIIDGLWPAWGPQAALLYEALAG
jgi:hypothetical protein